MVKLVASALFLMIAIGCSPKVQQQRPPKIEEEDDGIAAMGEGPDMAEEPTAIEPAKAKKVDPAQVKAGCCSECVKALANDRSGDDPTKIPCADLTSDVSEKCVKWFRDNPVVASEAAACSAAPASDAAAATE